MDIEIAFGRIRSAFPCVARFQGVHFMYAFRGEVWMIERKIDDRFFYWLLWNGNAKLIHASRKSKLKPMQTIGDSFSPSLAYD